MTQILQKNHSAERKTDFYTAAQNFFSPSFHFCQKRKLVFRSSQNKFTCLICLGDLFISADAYIFEISQVDGQLQSAGT